MKKIVLSLIAASLYAQCPCPSFDSSLPTNCVYLPPRSECSDYYASLDFLWWQSSEKGLEYASKNEQSFFNQKLQLYAPTFNFNPAFRLGAGLHLPYDHWDLEFAYTFYYTNTTNHAHHDLSHNPEGGIRSIWTSATAFQGTIFHTLWQNAKAEWKLHTNIFDLLLKQRFCISSAIALEPSFGIKFALLQQNYQVSYQNGNSFAGRDFVSSVIGMNNRTLNVGPSAGFLTKWALSDHLDLLGGLSGSLMAARFTIARNELDTSITSVPQLDSIRERNIYWLLRPQSAVTLGLSWHNSFCRNHTIIPYGLSASYEGQLFWKQNMLYRFIDETNAAMVAPTQGDLYFQGLTLNGFIDF